MIEWKQEEQAAAPADVRLSKEDKAACDKALYYLQFSGKTENELRKKLAENGFPPASVDNAVAFLKNYRYLDDEEYARRYLEKNGRKKSKKQILYELRQKGIEEDVFEQVFEEMPVDEEAQILALLAKKKYPGDSAGREEKNKISAYFARKGFSYDAIHAALLHYVPEEWQ